MEKCSKVHLKKIEITLMSIIMTEQTTNLKKKYNQMDYFLM